MYSIRILFTYLLKAKSFISFISFINYYITTTPFGSRAIYHIVSFVFTVDARTIEKTMYLSNEKALLESYFVKTSRMNLRTRISDYSHCEPDYPYKC